MTEEDGMAIYENCIMFNLAKAYQRVHSEFKQRFSKFGLTPIQLLVLEALFEEEGLSSGEIGTRLVLDSATLSGVLERMIAAGWIVKKVSKNDRRAVEITLTDRANALREDVLKAVEDANDAVLGSFRVEEKLLLTRFLTDLRQ